MKRSITVVLSTAALAVAVLTLGLHKQSSADEGNFPSNTIPWPVKPLSNVILPSKGSGKSFILQGFKMVKEPGFSQEWRQLDSATIHWDESHMSLIEDQDYRRDQSVVKSVKHFPGITIEERGGLRRIAHYDIDGTFLKHEVYRKNGTLERQGAYVKKNDQYVQTYYFEDGKTVQRSRIFFREIRTENVNVEKDGKNWVETISIPTKKFKLLKEEVFQQTPQGVIPESEVWFIQGGGGYFKKVFNAEGLKIGSVSQGANVKEHGEIYSPDGKNLLVEYDLAYGMQPGTMSYFRLDGTMWQSRMMLLGATNILIYDETGKKILYKQIWRERPADGPKPAYSILSKVDLYDPVTNEQSVTINMVNNGSLIDYVYYRLPNGKLLYKYLDKDGYIIRTELRNGNKVEETDTSSVREKLSFEGVLFKRDDPIKLTDYNFNDPRAPAWTYDYEDQAYPKIGDYIP